MKTKLKRLVFYCFPVLVVMLTSCSDFLDVDTPPTQVSSGSIFKDDAAASSAMSGIYSEMMSSSGFASGGLSSVTLLAGRSGDDFKSYSRNATAEFFENEITENNSFLYNNLWRESYRYIYDINAIIEGIDASSGLSGAVKQQLTGEAKFLRAFCYFYLVNLFDAVPLITTTDYRVNSVAPRAEASKVYDQIVLDLKDAKALLLEDYGASDGEKGRPNKWAAMAMLSRTYLYRKAWADAEAEANLIIENGPFSLDELSDVFLANSDEAIWQLVPHKGTTNTKEGFVFILTNTPTEVSLSDDLYSAFTPSDLRKTVWTKAAMFGGKEYRYPFKYKIKSGADLQEYSMVLRLAEQYLIRAEARAQLENLNGAIADVDIIRERAGLDKYQDIGPDMNQQHILLAVEEERRLELFSEWGHRWLDLKRTGRATAVFSAKPGVSWEDSDIWYPVPFTEIQNNINLLPQNPGY